MTLFFDDHRFCLHLAAEPSGIEEAHYGLADQSSADPSGDEGFVAHGKSTADVSRWSNDQIASRIDGSGRARGDGNIREFDSCVTFGTERGSRTSRDFVSLTTMVAANLT